MQKGFCQCTYISDISWVIEGVSKMETDEQQDLAHFGMIVAGKFYLMENHQLQNQTQAYNRFLTEPWPKMMDESSLQLLTH